LSEDDCQMIFVDTPGIHGNQDKALNRYMNRAAGTAIRDVDVIVFVVDRDKWSEGDEMVAQRVFQQDIPIIIAVNKMDRVEDKESMLPHIKELAERFPKAEILPLAALQGQNLEQLKTLLREKMPEREFFY